MRLSIIVESKLHVKLPFRIDSQSELRQSIGKVHCRDSWYVLYESRHCAIAAIAATRGPQEESVVLPVHCAPPFFKAAPLFALSLPFSVPALHCAYQSLLLVRVSCISAILEEFLLCIW